MKNLEWDEEDQPEEGVMWRAADGSFCAEIREYEGGYMLHLEVDAHNLTHAKGWARRFLEIVCEGDGEVSKWTDEERAAYLDCPECSEPAIPASSVDRVNGRLVFQWTENDKAVCPRCKANLIAFITGDENGDFFEARVRDDEEVSK